MWDPSHEDVCRQDRTGRRASALWRRHGQGADAPAWSSADRPERGAWQRIAAIGAQQMQRRGCQIENVGLAQARSGRDGRTVRDHEALGAVVAAPAVGDPAGRRTLDAAEARRNHRFVDRCGAVLPADHEVGQAVPRRALREELLRPADFRDQRLPGGRVGERSEPVRDLLAQRVVRGWRRDSRGLAALQIDPDVALEIGAQRECLSARPVDSARRPQGHGAIAQRRRHRQGQTAAQAERQRFA